MDRSLDLLSELLPDLKKYSAQTENPTLEGFKAYLTGDEQKTDVQAIPHSSAIQQMDQYGDDKASIAFHLARLGKYAKYYIKQAFKDIEFSSADDFGFLAAVIEHGEISKSKLIQYNVHEIPSGMEIIKRLIRNGLVEEKTDRNDRRIKILKSTPKGQETLFKAIGKMKHIADIVTGKMSKEDRLSLLQKLRELDHFHENIYKQEELMDAEILVRKYIQNT